MLKNRSSLQEFPKTAGGLALAGQISGACGHSLDRLRTPKLLSRYLAACVDDTAPREESRCYIYLVRLVRRRLHFSCLNHREICPKDVLQEFPGP